MKLFTEHPASVGESYFEHMGMAGSFGLRMTLGGLACLLHGLFPFLFVKTGSRLIKDLHQEMVTNRDRRKSSEASGKLTEASPVSGHPVSGHPVPGHPVS